MVTIAAWAGHASMDENIACTAPSLYLRGLRSASSIAPPLPRRVRPPIVPDWDRWHCGIGIGLWATPSLGGVIELSSGGSL